MQAPFRRAGLTRDHRAAKSSVRGTRVGHNQSGPNVGFRELKFGLRQAIRRRPWIWQRLEGRDRLSPTSARLDA